MSTIINNEGLSHSDTLQIPDVLNVSNITPSTGNIITIENTKSLRIPRHPAPGSSVESTGENGQMRFNTTSNTFEFYRNSNWTTLNYGTIGDSANSTHVCETFPVPTNTFQFYGYNNVYGNKNFSSLKDLYSDASFQLFGGAVLRDISGIYTDGIDDWAAFPKEVTNFSTNNFTISWWMAIDDLATSELILNLAYNTTNSITISYDDYVHSNGTNDGNTQIRLHDRAKNSDTRSNILISGGQQITSGTLYNYVLVKEDLSFSLYFDRTLIIQHTTVNGYTFPDMYANFGTSDYNTLNDNFVSFGTAAPRSDDGGYVYSKKRIYRVDIWNQAINTQANIDNIYYNGYIYPFYNGMKMVVNNKLGLHIQPTDYTVQYINYNKGYVGIGHTEPECMLDVSGSIGLHSLTIDDPNDEGQSKLYYKTGSGLTLEMSGNDYWSRTAIASSVTAFSTGSSANAYSNRLQTSFDNNMSFANTSYNAPTPTGYNSLGPKVKIKDNAIVGKSFVEANSSAPSNTLIIENALELNNSDVKSYFKDAIAAYFFEIDGGVGSIEDVVRGPGHAACDVSHNVYNETKLTNYGFDLSGDNVNSFMSIPDMYLPSNGEFSICVRFIPQHPLGTNATGAQDIYHADLTNIYNISEYYGSIRIMTTRDTGVSTRNIQISFEETDPNTVGNTVSGETNHGTIHFRAQDIPEINTTNYGNQWLFIVVNIKPHSIPELYVNGTFYALTAVEWGTNVSQTIDGILPDLPRNYGGKMLTPAKVLGTAINPATEIRTGDFSNPYSYTFGLGRNASLNYGYYSTYMVFGRTLNSDDTSFWTTALDGYEYCLGDLIKQHRGDKFNAHNRVYIDNSYVLHAEEANFQKNAVTRGDVKANRLVAGNVTLEHGKAIINNSTYLISAYYFEKLGGGKGSINDAIRDPLNTGSHIIKTYTHTDFDSNTYLTEYGINKSNNTNTHFQVPSISLPSNGVFTLSFRYKITSGGVGEEGGADGWQQLYRAQVKRVTQTPVQRKQYIPHISISRTGRGGSGSQYIPSSTGGGLNIEFSKVLDTSNEISDLSQNHQPYAQDNRYQCQIDDGYQQRNKWYHLVIIIIPGEYKPIIYLNNVQKTVYNGQYGVSKTYNTFFDIFKGATLQPYDNITTPSNYTIRSLTFGNNSRGLAGNSAVGEPYAYDESGVDYRNFIGYLSTYQVFNGALSANDVNYWYKKLNNTTQFENNSFVLSKWNPSLKDPLYYHKGLISAYYFQKYGAKGSIEDDVRGNGYEIKNRLNDSYDSKTYLGTYGINHALTATPDSYTGAQVSDASIVNSYCSIPTIQLPNTGVFTLQFRYYVKHDNQTDGSDNEFWRATITGEGNNSRVTNSGTLSLIRKGGGIGNSNPDYEGWTLYAHDNDGGGKAFQIYGNWKGYEVAQWNTLTLVIKPYSTPIIYLNGVFAPFTDATRYNIINSNWSSKDIGPVTGTPTGSYTNPQYITFGGYNGGTVGGDTNFKQSTQQFQGYIGSYQIFNYALSPDDISYWFYALNGQGASKPKTLSVGNSYIYDSNTDNNFGNGSGQTWKDWRVSNGGSASYTFTSDRRIQMLANQPSRICLFNRGNYTNYIYSSDLLANDDDSAGIAFSYSQNNNFNNEGSSYDSYNGFSFGFNDYQNTVFAHKYVNGTRTELFVETDTRVTKTDFHNLKVIVNDNIIEFYITFNLTTEVLFYTHIDTDNIINQGTHFGVIDYGYNDMDDATYGGAGLGAISGWKNIKLYNILDHEHGINYDAKFDYVTKYNKSLQHISASDSMKMVICNQINRSHGNTLIYKQDQATRFGFKQSSNADIALNPDVTMEVAHTFRTSKDFLFNSGGPNDSIIYNINNDNTTVFDGTTATVWPYGLYNKLQGERYNTNGIINDIGSTPNWIFQSDNTIKTNNNGEAEILYINRSALNSNHFTIECQIKPNDDDFAGIVLGVDPNTYQALVLYIYPQVGIIRIQLFSEGSGAGDNKFALDYSTGASNVLAESTSHNNNTYSFSNGNSVYINDYSSSTPFYNVKAIINNNIINAYIDNTLIFTVTHSYQHILDKRNIGILSSVMGSFDGVTFKDLRVYNYSSMTMHYLNTNSVNNVNNEITLQGLDNTITIASNTISSDGNLHFIGNVVIDGNLKLPQNAIDNIKYNSSTHIVNIQNINKINENVIIKPRNTTITSAVEIINTNSNNEFMSLNVGDSSDTNEKVRFNNSGVGIGTTNAENYALNVVGGNANCYGVYPVGSIIMFGGINGDTNVPSGWLLCDGAEYANDDYPTLASIIGTNYGGIADSSFNVPNLSNRSVFGSADVSDINFSSNENVKNTSDKRGGNATLTTNQLASHSHIINYKYNNSNWNSNMTKDGTSTVANSNSFEKYLPYTTNYNSTNEEGIGRYAIDHNVSSGGINRYNNVTNSIANDSSACNVSGSTYYNRFRATGLDLRKFDVNYNANGQLYNTLHKANANNDVKYYYNVNTNNVSSEINNVNINSSGNGNDFYPPSTNIKYIIYSGVHDTNTYPWK